MRWIKLTFVPPVIFFIRQAAVLSNKKETAGSGMNHPLAKRSVFEVNAHRLQDVSRLVKQGVLKTPKHICK